VLITTAPAKPPRLLFRRCRKEGIKNGLYSIHILMLDGHLTAATPVVRGLARRKKMRGGDAFFSDYGRRLYREWRNGRWRGDELVKTTKHTPEPRRGGPVFGGYEVGIGFSGTYRDEMAVGRRGWWRSPGKRQGIRFRRSPQEARGTGKKTRSAFP